jgi:uncharacterized RDD family membrane protein YckC
MTEGPRADREGDAPGRLQRVKARLLDGLTLASLVFWLLVVVVPDMEILYIRGEAALVICVNFAVALLFYLLMTLREPRDRATLGQKAMGLEMLPGEGSSASPWRWWFVARLPLFVLFSHVLIHTSIFYYVLDRSGSRWDYYTYPGLERGRVVTFRLGVGVLVFQVGWGMMNAMLALRGASLAEWAGGLRERCVRRGASESTGVIRRGVGFAPRFGATCIDAFLLAILLIGISESILHVRRALDYAWWGFFQYVYFVVPFVFIAYTFAEARTGWTPGKWLLGLRIAARDATPLPASRLFLRWLIRRPAELFVVTLTVLPVFRWGERFLGDLTQWIAPITIFLVVGFEVVSGLACFFGRGRRALHDLICGTNVFYADEIGTSRGGFEPLMRAEGFSSPVLPTIGTRPGGDLP